MRIINIRIPVGGLELEKFRLRVDGNINSWDYSSSYTHHRCSAPVKYRGRTIGWRHFKQFSDHEGVFEEMYYFTFYIEHLLPALHEQGLKLRDLIALAK